MHDETDVKPINLIIADDHTLFRRGLASLLGETGEFHVAGEARNGTEAVELAARLCPDVVLMDIHMPDGNGIEALRRMQAVCPNVPVIMLTVSEADDDLLDAIRAGARGYFLKNADYDELAAGIRRVSGGQPMLDPSLTETVFRHLARPTDESLAIRPSPLSVRETQVLRMVAEGHTNREIALQLTVSENTVKTHVRRILQKLEVSSRDQAVAQARQSGWL